jgi:hypothetical protein
VLVAPKDERPKPTEVVGLDPAQFRVPASDAKGHSLRFFFRAQPGHGKALESIIQSKKFPYRTKGDMLRHAFVRHLRWLDSIEHVPSVTAEVDAIMEVMRDDEFASDFAAVFEKVGQRISSHVGNGAMGEARRLLLTIMTHVRRMPDGYWRDKYDSEIRERYGHILSTASSASLRSSSLDDS